MPISHGNKPRYLAMYLVDTDVVSETRKQSRANIGVTRFFASCVTESTPVSVSVVTIGELGRGVELFRHRGDAAQAKRLNVWLNKLLVDFAD
jgi:toxin FitB